MKTVQLQNGRQQKKGRQKQNKLNHGCIGILYNIYISYNDGCIGSQGIP